MYSDLIKREPAVPTAIDGMSNQSGDQNVVIVRKNITDKHKTNSNLLLQSTTIRMKDFGIANRDITQK
jgi:hypothetical protein